LQVMARNLSNKAIGGYLNILWIFPALP